MSPSQNDKKQIRTGNRFNFDPLPSDNSWPDWRIPDLVSGAAPGGQAIGELSADRYDQHKHEPAPMQKRAKIVKRVRKSKRFGGWWPTVVFGSLIGLASFSIVFDLVGDGKLRHFIQSNLVPPESAEPDKIVVSKDLPAPAPQKIAEVLEPKAPPVQASPPTKTETAVPPVVLLPEPREPLQATVDAARQVELVPSSPPETALAPERPVDTAKQVAAATPVAPPQQQGNVIRDCADCPELVVVSAGSFAKVDAVSVNAPAKVASIDHDFAIGRNDISFDDWDKCVADGACKPIADDAGWGRGNRPLIFVSFDDVTTQYLPWLSRLTGKAYRLPSKDEWQYAALGGKGAAETKNQIGDQSKDCFNASGPPAANCPDTYNGTAPVGSFPPSALGLNDMKGNVWKWSADCWRPFNYAPNASPNVCDMRVVLGGAWSTNRSEVIGKVAGWEKSSRRTNSIGFRVVRSLP